MRPVSHHAVQGWSTCSPLSWPLAAAAAGLAYASAYEVRAFTLREVTVPVLAAGLEPAARAAPVATPT